MSFRRPIGAQADLKELEYVSALHQTGLPLLRDNGTVSSIDIQRFLKSRIGIEADHSLHCLRIVRGLGGGVLGDEAIEQILNSQDSTGAKSPEEAMKKEHLGLFKKRRAKKQDDVEAQEKETKEEEAEKPNEDETFEEYLDLVQLLAALLIPTLARAGKEWRGEHGEGNEEDSREGVYEEEEGQKQSVFARIEAWDKARREVKSQELYESLRPKPESLLKDSLTVLLHSTTAQVDGECKSSLNYPAVTPALVQELLESNGEYERAADTALVEKMVAAASSKSGLLDEEAFVNAITSDVSEYPIGSEDQLTTMFYDVFGFESFEERKRQLEDESNIEGVAKDSNGIDDVTDMGDNTKEKEGVPSYRLEIGNVLSPIDFSIDAHSSSVLMIGTWVFFVFTVILYATLFQSMDALQKQCDSKTFSCQIRSTIIVWMVFACIFVVVGYVMIIPLSFGNNPRRRSPRSTAFSLFLCAVYTWMPFVTITLYRDQREQPYNGMEEAVSGPYFSNSMNLVLAIGCLLMAIYFHQFVLSLLGNRRIRESELLNRLFATSTVRGVARTKKAATRKINTMLQNAQCLHSSVSGHLSAASLNTRSSLRAKNGSEEAMVNYVLRGESYENCGGLLWTWKRIFNGSLFDTEGVWFCSRLLVFQFCQLVFALLLSYIVFTFVETVAVEADAATKDLEENHPDAPDWVKDIVPTGAQARGALYPAAVVAVLVMITLILIYLPSYTSTTIMYRTGVIPSLKSHYFTKYRTNVDLVYGNIGNAIFALLGSAGLFWALTALVLFLFLWEFSRNFMILVTAWGIGLTITIVLKMMLTKLCRKKFFAGFYRTRPGAANLSTLALECWFIGLGGGVLVGRFTQFILAACFWVGRTDVPFLSEDVSVMGYAFDYVPTNFVKDLLVHDAHHHPYLERLLTMYLLKLKNDSFCTDAGACWRQLLVVSLMPWMMKSRVFSDKRLADAMKAFTDRRVELEEESRPRGFKEEVMSGLNDMAEQVVDRRPEESESADEDN